MNSQDIKFGEKEVNKKDFYSFKSAILLNNVDVSKIIVSNSHKINNIISNFFFVYAKYSEVWDKVKKLLKFTTSPIRNEKYILAKLKIFNGVNKTTFTNVEVPIEKNHYMCIAAIDIDSVLKIDKKVYPQVYLEQCKYKLKKRRPANFIDIDVKTDTDSDSDN